MYWEPNIVGKGGIMKKEFLWIVSVSLAMCFLSYAQSQNIAIQQIELNLLWEKQIPQGTTDFVFLDDNGYNVFSSQCENPEKALNEKMLFIVTKGNVRLSLGDNLDIMRETGLNPYSKVAISKNGRNFAVLEHVISGKVELGQWYLNVEKSMVRLINWRHEELAHVELPPLPHARIYVIGNDSTVVLSDAGEDGHYTNIIVLSRQGSTLESACVFTEGLYPTSVFDYAEDGSCIFIIYNGTRIILDGMGNELTRYDYQQQGWVGYVSPSGNYLMEVTRGKHVAIRDKTGRLTGEHLVQGIGNYFAVFSSDEKYLCVSPGPWLIYLFMTENGELLWTYTDISKESHFSSLAVIPSVQLAFAGRSEAIIEPGEFKGTVEELNSAVIENATKDRSVYLVGNGAFLGKYGPFPGQGFGTQLQAPEVCSTADERYLLVRTPTKIFVYRLSVGGE